MPDNYKSLPFIVGVSLLFLVPVGIGAFAYSSLRDNSDEQQTTEADSLPESSPFEGLPREQNIQAAPMPSTENGGSAEIDSDSSQGIPIGKYSNPPTQIESYGKNTTPRTRPLDDSGSIVDRNRFIQQDADRQAPDYSTPSASNNFKDTEDNSLIEPLEDDSFLEVPETEDETPPLSPVAEPLFGQ